MNKWKHYFINLWQGFFYVYRQYFVHKNTNTSYMRSLQNFEKSILRIYMDGGFKISTLYWFNTGKIL